MAYPAILHYTKKKTCSVNRMERAVCSVFFYYAESVKHGLVYIFITKKKTLDCGCLMKAQSTPPDVYRSSQFKKKMATYTKKFTILLNVHTPTTHSLEMPLTFYYFFFVGKATRARDKHEP